MAHALAKENKQFIKRMIQRGRFNNQSEVIREALRRMERTEAAYLNPSPLTQQEMRRIYGPDLEEEQREKAVGRKLGPSVRAMVHRRKLKLDAL